MTAFLLQGKIDEGSTHTRYNFKMFKNELDYWILEEADGHEFSPTEEPLYVYRKCVRCGIWVVEAAYGSNLMYDFKYGNYTCNEFKLKGLIK